MTVTLSITSLDTFMALQKEFPALRLVLVPRHAERGNDIEKTKIEEFIRKTDKRRANYYEYYTDRKWGVAKNYDLCINSSFVGIEGAVKLISGAIANAIIEGNEGKMGAAAAEEAEAEADEAVEE